MSLTKKDFIKFAEIIKLNLNNNSERQNIAEAFSIYFKEENPQFNKELFLKACLD